MPLSPATLPYIVLVESSTNLNDNLLLNFKRPIFQDPRVRRAINLAIDRKGYVQAGAGIVADSVPELEHQESLNKAQAVIRAIERARGL